MSSRWDNDLVTHGQLEASIGSLREDLKEDIRVLQIWHCALLQEVRDLQERIERMNGEHK